MRTITPPTLCLLCLLAVVSTSVQAQKPRNMHAFEHLALSINAGTTGAGAQLAVPLNSNLALRGGFSTLPVTYSYHYESVGENGDDFTIPMDAKAEMLNGNLMLDIFPVRDSRFHFTAGVVYGSDRILTVAGHSPYDEPVEIGDTWIRPDELGNVSAWIATERVKPYLGIGFGRTIPRRRLGFKFELGGLFQGTPRVTTDNPIVNDSVLGQQEEINELNRYLNDYFRVYPVLSFQLTYRIF